MKQRAGVYCSFLHSCFCHKRLGQRPFGPLIWRPGLNFSSLHRWLSGSGQGDGAVEALKNVKLTVAPGEVVGLVGPSGSGKSTLLKCLGAIIEPTSGRMTLGHDVIFDKRWKVADLRALRRDRQRRAAADAGGAVQGRFTPAGAGTAERALGVMRILNQMARQFQVAIIVVRHDEKIITAFQRIYHIRDGQTVEEAGLGRCLT